MEIFQIIQDNMIKNKKMKIKSLLMKKIRQI